MHLSMSARHGRAPQPPHRLRRQTFRQHLVDIGVCYSAAAALQHPEPYLLAQFKVWLRKHRGASDRTIKIYARDATHLMAALGDEPEGWEPAAIRSFFLDRASHCGNGTVEKLTTSLRAFLRYLAVKGRCRAGLADVVPGYAHWRLAGLPRYLVAEQVNRLIAACDGEVVARRRDRAIVLLLARLGLRAGDVAQLRLDDIEWETGSLRVQASRATRCVYRFRKTSGMRLSPTSRAAIRLARAIITCSCAISRRIDRSGKVTASRQW